MAKHKNNVMPAASKSASTAFGSLAPWSAAAVGPVAQGGHTRAGRAPRLNTSGAARCQIRNPNSEFRNDRSAFTLVEMLVAVGLVMLMMVLFATIFQMATGAMATQKGLTENDQRVRAVVTQLRNDLRGWKKDPVFGGPVQYRTFRWVVPISPADASQLPIPPTNLQVDPIADRVGYLYISEGNVSDDTDDLLQLTVTYPPDSTDRFFGRATQVTDAAGNYGPGNNNPNSTPVYLNQPAFDALFTLPPIGAGSSRSAEVAYFLRNGTLYRRVLLLRLPASTLAIAPDVNPTDNNSLDLPLTLYANGTKNFLTDFDYAATFNSTLGYAQFHSDGDLSNGLTTLQNPQFRWGFDSTSAAGSGLGLPKELIGTNFIGRYTHAETSDPTFIVPGAASGGSGNPFANANAALTYSNGSVTNFPNGTRKGEDIVLTNVIAFDIKVWDPAASLGPDGKPGIANFDDDGINGIDDYGELGAYNSDDGDWRDLGHAGYSPNPPAFPVPPPPQQQAPYGFYRAPPTAAQNPNIYFSNPNATPPTNRFDTWGTTNFLSSAAATAADEPPYRPVYAGPDGAPGIAGTSLLSGASLGTPGSDDFAPLTAIKITIRFYDVTSNQIRDISGVYSLVPQ
jgi:type II secretory pathway pseudopilin PulG